MRPGTPHTDTMRGLLSAVQEQDWTHWALSDWNSELAALGGTDTNQVLEKKGFCTAVTESSSSSVWKKEEWTKTLSKPLAAGDNGLHFGFTFIGQPLTGIIAFKPGSDRQTQKLLHSQWRVGAKGNLQIPSRTESTLTSFIWHILLHPYLTTVTRNLCDCYKL